MNTISLIRKKRNGAPLTSGEIKYLIDAYTKKEIPDYQMSAFLMAVYFNGMDKDETAALTDAMLHSGSVIDLGEIPGAKIDKHSTGGVGDKTSLILAPIAAAAGINVPMISGRALGHTGGTLDKLESINGFNTNLSLSEYKSVIGKIGAVLIGQTKEIAPADKLIYSLRDVTATVESIPLITASIMSKKLAEGIDGLVLDVKTGSGAFMAKLEDAKQLADNLISTAKAFNKKVIAFITDMSQPLGKYIGNWLEVYESIKVLQGEDSADLKELSVTLSGAMIYIGGKAGSLEEGIEISNEMIKNGKAFEKFVEIVKAQDGDTSLIHNPESYPKSTYNEVIKSETDGYLEAINTFDMGMAAFELGAGRKTLDDKIDPRAGMIFHPKIGDKISKGDIIAELFTEQENKIAQVKDMITGALKFNESPVTKRELIIETLN